MSNQIHIIQNAITTTISEIFRGDFRRICEVKKAVLHLEDLLLPWHLLSSQAREYAN